MIQTRLIAICDDLLAATGHLREAAQTAGHPWPTPEAKQIIDRILDTRIELQKTTSQPQPKQRNAN